MKFVEEVQTSPRLLGLVLRCSPFAREAFTRLLAYLPAATRRPEFELYIRSIRNKAAFHYDRRLVEAALASRAARPGSDRATITRASEASMWRSGLADDIEDTIVCRFLWKIPLSADLTTEANKIADFGSSACRDYVDLAGELSFLFLRDTATV